MITWNEFAYFAVPSVLLWIAGAWAAWRDERTLRQTQGRLLAIVMTMTGIVVFFSFIILLWMSLERPPLRTMGETRLWYSAFLPVAGIAVYMRWRYKWILSFSTLLALVFICINIFKPEIHSKTLMPALQSPWFAPHVIIYMFCYAILGAATLLAAAQLVSEKTRKRLKLFTFDYSLCDNLVAVGIAFMTIGMLFGALWAKEAWGHYWAWDPKETWAASTWLLYLGYIHLRKASPQKQRMASWLLIISFCCLQMCWWGINYLPTAQGNSVHTYTTD